MCINNNPITTAGINRPTAGTKIAGKNEAANSPVIFAMFLYQIVKSLSTWILHLQQHYLRRNIKILNKITFLNH